MQRTSALVDVRHAVLVVGALLEMGWSVIAGVQERREIAHPLAPELLVGRVEVAGRYWSLTGRDTTSM
ncbi:hypothetical protein ADL15_40240 [Actinoplanes awajinensis subsp. mycoplanecinus]|uniref:Uncharacterized protein n=1 Tax=Actinoplanes awajinensis subsp. mycoplanecinus TaxID=135947 RepID=A0A101JF36_9ACTN|nr:hypothetical protein ADL15_40240 [Actinoplanes awajinensis subsp. mycoplanecinus]